MNILSFLGLAVLAVAFVTAFSEAEGVDFFEDYMQMSGLAVVIGGTLGATLLKSSASDFKAGMSLLPRIFMNPMSPVSIIDQLVELADVARKDGLIALESHEVKHPFLAKGIQLLVDGQKPELVAKTLDAESDAQAKRERHGVSVWSYMGEVAPAMGMVGTLIGLVALLKNMDSQAALTSGMALALLTTLYGAVLANAIALPIANKMRVQSEVEELNREIIQDGVSYIQTGGNPRVLADMLASYVPPSQAAKLSIYAK